MKAAAAVLLALGLGGAASPVDQLAGQYSRSHVIGFVNDPSERVTDELLIVKTTPTTAFVEADLYFYNGHMCGFLGIAKVRGDALVYRDPDPLDLAEPCELTIRRSGDRIVIQEDNGACRAKSCGARGAYGGEGFAVSSRRPVRDVDRVLNSYNHRAAREGYLASTRR